MGGIEQRLCAGLGKEDFEVVVAVDQGAEFAKGGLRVKWLESFDRAVFDCDGQRLPGT